MDEQYIQIIDDTGTVIKTYKVPEGKDQFEDVVWEGEFLYGAQFNNANFRNADIYCAAFFMAQLNGANFENAHLRGADLKDASCIGTNFRNADLRRNSLGGGSQLQGTDLTKAILNRAKLEGAEYDETTKFPKGFHPNSHGMIEKERKA